MPSPKLVNFLDLNSAVLVDQLDRPSIRPLLSHLFRRCPDLSDHFRRPSAATNRDLAISLLDLLRREGGQPILMVFLWALLQSGHLLLFCRFIQLHLVDSLRFEQFAKTTDGGAVVAPLRHDLELPKFEDAIDSSSSTDLAAHRREFVERHAEMVRMKLGEAERIREMMEEWGTIPGMVTENGEGGGENGVAAGCEPLIALLLAQNQPHRAFDSFCLALLTSRQFRMFSIFHELADLKWLDQCWRYLVENAEDGGENGEEEDESEEEEEEEGLPSMLKGVLEDLRVETVDSAGNNGKFDFLAYYRAHKNDIYPNFSSPRGLALIINNYRFQGRAQREGSQVDATNISNLLQQLDYKVLLKNDMTAEQIRWAMAEFASLPDHQHLDSAIVVLMSHGEFEVILGTDDRPVDVHELIGLVNQNALGLRGKPKIFIVQACRGAEFDEGIPRALRADESTDGGASSLWSLFSKPKKRRQMNVSGLLRANPVPPSPKPQSSGTGSLSMERRQIVVAPSVREPTEVDVLIAYPTTPHYVSWRNSSTGSWFVQTLCEVFSRRAKEEDILSMLTRVNREVAKREANCEKKWKQAPEVCTRLRKRFFFFPGLKQGGGGGE